MATGATPPTAASVRAGTASRHVVDRRGGFALTADQVEGARVHIRDQAVSGQRRRDRVTRIDPRDLAILTDYIAWLEKQLEAEEQAHIETRVHFAESLNKAEATARESAATYQRELTSVLRRLQTGRTLVLRRPRWRVWRWPSWWQRIADWLDPAGAPNAEPVDG